MKDVRVTRRKRKRLEGGVRRSLEILVLIISLVVGLGVVGGCGSVAVLAMTDYGALGVIGVFVVAALLIGVVYLATTMSRDVRILRERLSDERRDPPV